MAVETLLDAAGLDVFDIMGQAAIFTPATGSTVSCQVVIDSAVKMQTEGQETQAWAGRFTIEGLISVLGREPNRDETFTVGATTYTVQTLLENNDERFYKAVVT